ncbi:MAG: hypothetical protein JSR80_05805 [Verrucomicrobia bacterium]|nr:hypothetical protein [Verrucomicrobiota bacterium]
MKKYLLLLLLLPLGLLAKPADVQRMPTSYEVQQIAFVLNTLANSSGPSLLFKKSALQKAGHQTGAVHPLRWMEVGLTDPHLKAQMKRIRQKPMVWKNFSQDMGASFERQWQSGTFNEEEIDAYATSIGVDPSGLRQAAAQGNWRKFIEISVDES